jgi:hypothetical protein
MLKFDLGRQPELMEQLSEWGEGVRRGEGGFI